MGYADRDPDPRPGPAHHYPAPVPPRSRYNHPRRPYEHARDVVMNRDDDHRGDRGRSDREPRGPHQSSRDRTRSISPATRRPDTFRGRDYPRDGRRDDFRERDDIPKRPRHRSRSPGSPNKRRRSPSPGSHHSSKKSKREREREKRRVRRNRHRPSSPHRRSPSPYQDYHRSDRPNSFDGQPFDRRSQSPYFSREAGSERGVSPHARRRGNSLLSERDRSPRPESRHSVLSRGQSPHPPNRSEAGSYSRRSTPSLDSAVLHRPPRSPFMDRPPPTGPSASRKKKRREEPWLGKRVQPSSGANSIEVNTSRRGDARSGFPSQPSPFPPKHSGHPHHDQSPSHSAFTTSRHDSRHGSPDAQSPPGITGQGLRNSHPQFASQNAPPSGPRAPGNQSPPHPPTGPANTGRGFSRNGFRGGSFSLARPDHRSGGFNPPTGPAAERVHAGHSGENTPNPSSASHHSDAVAHALDDSHDDKSSQQANESQVDDSNADQRDDDVMRDIQPSVRGPPTGPAVSTPTGPRISFSFKATSKAPVAAPKPEISQKFSAAPPRRDPPQPADDRSNRDRDLPKDTPTGPASSRARHEPDHHSRHRAPEPPRGPRQPDSSRGPRQPEPARGPRQPEPPRPLRQPRTRKVLRIEKRLKPKPTLPEHLALSESPFYRKPGNESVVGSGTYGKVFKGKHVYSGRLVALKKIRMEGEKDGFPVTAVREIKLLQSLRHDNIVALQEVMIEKDDCYMVFEYLSHDLTGLLNHPSFTLDPAQRKHLAKQLFEGLDYLHARGVLHRDIKAANILVSSNGILKLADFGLARFYAKHHNNDYTNRVITIWYRSPELLLGETQYTAAVDIWSAACVMVEIFTRHAIFPGDGTEINQLDKIYAILGTPNKIDWPDLVKMEWFELLRPGYRKPSIFAEKYREKIPPAAFQLLASMFQYDPAKRPSAAEVLEHPYFTTEYPPPRQAVELADIQGEWHEFESKALRREKEKKERQEREARRAAQAKEAGKTEREGGQRDNDKKRPGSSHDDRDTKRLHTEGKPSGAP
ncbi:putative Protein kinase domain-containing protein [Seiridium cardinale]|uniref:cyclin-dependent kinase n=1 Tax=Seiridium cardinale TaxID=138064 RepID=A0ABR2X8P5_9PEZI